MGESKKKLWPGRTKLSAPRVFSIEGLIGAGKTTLIAALADALRALDLEVCTVLEPVAEWRACGILAAFYADPQAHAYKFQTYTFVTRITAAQRAVALQPNADVYLLERTPLTDRYVFMELQRMMLTTCEMTMYDALFDCVYLLYPFTFADISYVYLATSPDKCMDRVAGRGRTEEVMTSEGKAEVPAKGGVSVIYQQMLRRAHEAFLLGMHKAEFPLMAAVPFERTNVIVINEMMANADIITQKEMMIKAWLLAMGLHHTK